MYFLIISPLELFCVSLFDVQIPFSYFICGQCIDIRGDMSNPWTRPCWLLKSKRIILENLIFYFKKLSPTNTLHRPVMLIHKKKTTLVVLLIYQYFLIWKKLHQIIIFNRKRICIIYSKILFSFDIRNIFKMWGKKEFIHVTTVGPSYVVQAKLSRYTVTE